MNRYGFRQKILLLAVALVVATQLVVLFPVLDVMKRDSAAQADRTVGLAGVLFDEYMHNRAEQLLTTVNVAVSDFPFKQAVVTDEDDATVAFTDLLPVIVVEKTAGVASVPESGGDVTFAVRVTNQSPEAVALDSLVDDVDV